MITYGAWVKLADNPPKTLMAYLEQGDLAEALKVLLDETQGDVDEALRIIKARLIDKLRREL